MTAKQAKQKKVVPASVLPDGKRTPVNDSGEPVTGDVPATEAKRAGWGETFGSWFGGTR